MLVKFTLSESALEQEYIATGSRKNASRSVVLNDAEFSADQRAALVKYKSLSPFGVSIDKMAVRPVQKSLFDGLPFKPVIKHYNFDLDSYPDVDQVIGHLARMQDEQRTAERELDREMVIYNNLKAAYDLGVNEAEIKRQLAANEAKRLSEESRARAIIPWNESGKAIVNLYAAIFACSGFIRDGRDGFAAWVKQIDHIDPSQPNGYSIVGSWVNDRTIEIEKGHKMVFLVANQTGSRKHSMTDYMVVYLDIDGFLIRADIQTDDSDRGWALRIRDQIADLLV